MTALNPTYQKNIDVKYQNVLSVVTDRLFATESTASSGLVDFYTADLVSSCDYYPAVYTERSLSRMAMGGRGKDGPTYGYRYGYQGSEKDDNIKGKGNSYTTYFRQFDVRLGRWLSIDLKLNAWESPYASMGLNPIWRNDPLGDIGVFRGRKYTTSSDVSVIIIKAKTNGWYGACSKCLRCR